MRMELHRCILPQLTEIWTSSSSCMRMVSIWKLKALSTWIQARTGLLSCTPVSYPSRSLKAVLRDPRRSAQTFSVSWEISARHLNSQNKRHRTYVSTYDRAVSLGVAHRLRDIPASLQLRIESGSSAERATAKKELHSLQRTNQQIVARVELQRLKVSKLAVAVLQ